jgi:hypothetical protein
MDNPRLYIIEDKIKDKKLKYDFIAKYEGSDGNKENFIILYKRLHKHDKSQKLDNPWVDISSTIDAYYDEDDEDGKNLRELYQAPPIKPELSITMPNKRYLVFASNTLDRNETVPIFDLLEEKVIMRPVIEKSQSKAPEAMDIQPEKVSEAMDIPPENNHEAEVLTRYNPNPEYKKVVGFLNIDGRKLRNLDIYKITYWRGMDFIGRYERFVDPNFDSRDPIDEEPYLLFTILFKRGRDLNINLPGFNVSRSYTYSYPWIKPEVPCCLKLEKDKNIIDEVDPCEIIEPRLEIPLTNLKNEDYIIEYSDYLDNNGLIEVFNEKTDSIEYASVEYFSTMDASSMDTKDASSMDTSGGKRRKSRRRTKRRRKGKKARKSRRHRK